MLTLAACLVLDGCNSTVTAPAVQPQPVLPNISGDYAGTIADSQNGTGDATATFAQNGSSAGGAITVTGQSATFTAQTAITISASNAYTGSMIVDYANGTTCTYGTAGTFDPQTYVLSGTYSAVAGCSGGTGKYTLTQQCYDTSTSRRRKALRILHC